MSQRATNDPNDAANPGVAKKDQMKRTQEFAWIGDAVLALWAREWLLKRDGEINADRFKSLTSNQFLSCIGTPTLVEARYGEIYSQHGLAEAFLAMDRDLVPLFERQESNRARKERGTHKR